jgi:hypothetical protein
MPDAIFMLNLDEEQKQEIKRYSRSLLGFHMATDKYFKKPQIALTYVSRTICGRRSRHH